MDVETLGAAMAQMKNSKSKLPEVAASDEGAVMVVGPDGKWTKGEVLENTITVSNHKLVISAN